MLKSLLAMLFWILPIVAFSEVFVAGKDYELVGKQVKTVEHNPVSIIEFFSYGCPGCYKLEPTVRDWQQHNLHQVSLVKRPVVFNNDWKYYAKAFYTIQALKMEDKLTPVLFKAIQLDKLALNTDPLMIDFMLKLGIDKDIVNSAFTHSTTIDINLAQGNQLMSLYHISAVPAFIVNSAYKTDLQMAQTPARLTKILDYLALKAQTASD